MSFKLLPGVSIISKNRVFFVKADLTILRLLHKYICDLCFIFIFVYKKALIEKSSKNRFFYSQADCKRGGAGEPARP